MTAIPAGPGDVLAVYGGGIAGEVIRFGEELLGKGGHSAHVAVVTHRDARGRWIGIQGEPGGVGLVDCTMFLNDSRTRSNHEQPRSRANGEVQVLLGACAKSLGLRYDWVGIEADASELVHAPDLTAELEKLWAWPSDRNVLPGHVVCSSLAAMLYDLPGVNWAHPGLGAERTCMPEDWWNWNNGAQWRRVKAELRVFGWGWLRFPLGRGCSGVEGQQRRGRQSGAPAESAPPHHPLRRGAFCCLHIFVT